MKPYAQLSCVENIKKLISNYAKSYIKRCAKLVKPRKTCISPEKAVKACKDLMRAYVKLTQVLHRP